MFPPHGECRTRTVDSRTAGNTLWGALAMPEHAGLLILVMIYILSFLMVSTIKYNSFKKPELFRKMNFNVLVAAILILIFIAAQPSIALFLIGVAYVVSGPFTTIKYNKTIEEHNAEPAK